MLLEFISNGPVWINPQLVIMVYDESDGAVLHFTGGERMVVKGTAKEAVARINPSTGEGLSSLMHLCRHCGHRYANYGHYVCGAVPNCPVCGKTQSSWEGAK